MLVRPEFVKLSATDGMLFGIVRRAMFLGNLTEYLVEVPGTDPWLVEMTGQINGPFEIGDPVRLSLAAAAMHVLVK